MGDLCDKESLTKLANLATADSDAMAVVRTTIRSGPTLTIPADTILFIDPRKGRDSPVTDDSSRKVFPEKMIPSQGILSPTGTETKAPIGT